MRVRIKKRRPALSKGLMRLDIENKAHTKRNQSDIPLHFLRYMQLQKE